MKQIEDIEFLQAHTGLERLPEIWPRRRLCGWSTGTPPLKELGQMLTPPVGKSGMNHRLRRLSEMAQKLRETGEYEERTE